MIQLQSIEKRYNSNGKQADVHALKNINLSVKQGEIFGVIGQSGAGKSTLIRCINLLEHPDSGKVFVAGEELTTLSARGLRQARQHIGMIFQHFNLLESKTVYGNIAFPLILAGKSKTEIHKVVKPLLELTGLESKTDSYPSQLSGGQKQRVAIARALANDPKVLLCDEATSALDPQTTVSILRLLKDINERLGLTIVLITHEMDVIKQICDRVALIEHGEIIETASITDFFTRPVSDTAKQLVKTSINKELPACIRNRLSEKPAVDKNPLLRIYFFGNATNEPLIAHLIKNIGIDMNILQANLEIIKNETLGVMTVEAITQNDKFAAAMQFLKEKNIQAEVIGYV